VRQIVLDTETTGLEPQAGHRIIEIGGVELVNRRLTGRHFHQYLNPQRDIDEGALQVHGIQTAFLADKPLFADVVADFTDFIDGAELVIHNAPFDVAFMDAELTRLPAAHRMVRERCMILDTLALARQMHPGQRNSLDALCKRYEVDNSQRELHGALLDAEILADVYLAMTGGQTSLALAAIAQAGQDLDVGTVRRIERRRPMRVVRPSQAEQAAHFERLEKIQAASGQCLWLDSAEDATQH
jgi:DNA polymerase III subunit epsilon